MLSTQKQSNVFVKPFETIKNKDNNTLTHTKHYPQVLKYQNYTQKSISNYFWRTYDQQELDWLEEQNGNLNGFEFKRNERKKSKIPTAFAKAYPEVTFEAINKQNYLYFIM